MADKDTRAFARVLKCFRLILERFCKGDGGRLRRVGGNWDFAYMYIYILKGLCKGGQWRNVGGLLQGY